MTLGDLYTQLLLELLAGYVHAYLLEFDGVLVRHAGGLRLEDGPPYLKQQTYRRTSSVSSEKHP